MQLLSKTACCSPKIAPFWVGWTSKRKQQHRCSSKKDQRVMSGTAMAKQNEQKFLLLMIFARCLNAAGLGLLFSASTDLLYQLTHPKKLSERSQKDDQKGEDSVEDSVHHKVQKTLTNIATLSTLLDFFLAPMIGSFMDSVGRLPTMMMAMGCSSTVRFCLAVSPSLKLYMCHGCHGLFSTDFLGI